jgi:hypothetical protein
MRVKEITESFDSNVPYSIVRAGNNLFTTRAEINGRTITFNAAGNYDYNGGSSTIWDIEFSEKTSQTGVTFGKTGNGGEMQVFSFVIASIKELIARYHPDVIEFASHKADQNRTKLYSRMASRIKLPGYTDAQLDTNNGSADDFFKFVRQGV